jgi:sulfur relay protein TusB/DsrH
MEGKNSIVYLYGFSPAKSDKAGSLIKILNEQIEQEIKIELVLIHDGVIRTTKKGMITKFLEELLELPIKVYAMTSDIKARGMDPKNLNNKIKDIDYDDLVDILVNTQKVVSWM